MTPTYTAAPTPSAPDLTRLGAIIARVPDARGHGSNDLAVIRDGDRPAVGTLDASRQYDTYDGMNSAIEDWIGYAYTTPQTFARVVFQEGMHFSSGGWFENLTVHVRQGGLWSAVSGLTINPAYPGAKDGETFETYTLSFTPASGDAIRIWGRPGGSADYVSVGELEVFGPIGGPTPTPAVTGNPTSTATLLPSPTSPTVAATPGAPVCGNGRLESGEQCDGADRGSCPALCRADCMCAESFDFPFEGWVVVRGTGTWSVVANDPTVGGPVLVTETSQGTGFGIAYPSSATLTVPLPLLSLTARASENYAIDVLIQPTKGREVVLSYEASDGVPTVLKRRARFPLGAALRSGTFQTVTRDLGADVKAAFGLSFGHVKQVALYGRLAVAHLGLSAPVPGAGGGPTLAQEVAVPLSGWTQGGPGTVSQGEYDPVLDGPTLSARPADMRRPRLQLALPQPSAEFVAAFRMLSLVVRDDERFALDVRVKTSAGPMRLRYQPDVSEPLLRGRTLRMPVPATAIEGSPYKLVSLELAAAVERARPGHRLTRLLGIRLQGKFRVGDVMLSEPLM